MQANRQKLGKDDPLKGIKGRRRKYAKGLIEGKTKKEAALDAGYSLSCARNPGYAIETPQLKEALAKMIHIVAPLERMATVMDEGLRADKVQISGQGDQAFAEVTPDHQERGRWWDRAVKFGYAPAEPIEVNVNHTHTSDDRLAQLVGRLAQRVADGRNSGGEG